MSEPIIRINDVDVPLMLVYLQKEKWTQERISFAVGKCKKTVMRWANEHNKPQDRDSIEALVNFARPRLTPEQMKRCGVDRG